MNGPVRRCFLCHDAMCAAQDGAVCPSCAGAVGLRRPIPPHFYDTPTLRQALADYDFGTIFAAVRAHTGLPQQALGDLVGLSQSRVSAVERRERGLSNVALIARIATALSIPAALLGFPAEPAATTVDDGSWMDRRDFVGLITAAALGSTFHPELGRLDSLLPRHTEPVTRPAIGAADVDAIEVITDGFRRSDFAHGGGLCRAAALAQLHQVRRLRDAACSPEVHTRLHVATAELASITGWMAYDVHDHDAARRLWTFALHTAGEGADHPRSSDLSVDLLLDMAHQALHLDRAQEALQLTQLASGTAASRQHPVSTITQGYISIVLGWCRAALGQPEAARRAIGDAEDIYGRADPATTPPWAWFVTPAEIAAQQGHALYLLSQTDPTFAPAAIERLSSAAEGYSEVYQRSRAMILPPLAVAHFQAGDIASAVTIGGEAVTAISGLSSTRGYARLRQLHKVAAAHARRPEVADLREQVRAAVTAAA